MSVDHIESKNGVNSSAGLIGKLKCVEELLGDTENRTSQFKVFQYLECQGDRVVVIQHSFSTILARVAGRARIGKYLYHQPVFQHSTLILSGSGLSCALHPLNF
jgi:hypothetical protein